MAPKPESKYYSIGEWYGKDVTRLNPDERRHFAELALSGKVKAKACPSRPERTCHKKGGVCSIRRYHRASPGGTIELGELVTTCPWRFFDGGEVFRWIGETMLDTSAPVVISEIPFMQKLPGSAGEFDDDDDAGFIGRIDNILVHPDRTARLHWCALEMQAVYFSGKAMSHEFKDVLDHPESLRFPVQKRHPDFRSSGPKRLLPQLQTKVPELSRWGRKLAVCVDESFFSALSEIEPVKHLSNADLAWFVVRFEPEDGVFRLKPARCVFSKLDSTVKALTGGVPLPLDVFEQQIKDKLPPAG